MKEYSAMQHPHSPTLDEIAQRAREIWSVSGHPFGHDTSIWLEAKRQLTVDLPWSNSAFLVGPTSAPGSAGHESSSSTIENSGH